VATSVQNYIKTRLFRQPLTEKSSAEAYDLWSASYDIQPGNLMLDLDEVLFSHFLYKTIIHNKAIADIGCGTGRHWPKILKLHPLSLTGFDVSEGMLNKLKDKFPSANTYQIKDDLFSTIRDDSFDTIISTLTVAHIENLDLALNAWCRILKKQGEIIITDFHPQLLGSGGKRTFKYNHMQVSIRNFVHHVDIIKDRLHENGFRVVAEEEIKIDETVKHYYTQQNALPVYEQF
jgi:ubiquinone/menaquinone biosynthesis C-methylase UbiE